MNRIIITLVLLVSCSVCCMGEVRHPDAITVRDVKLKKAGQAILARWFIKGCNMAFYVPDGIKKDTILKDGHRCLEFYYYRAIKADQFSHAAWETIKVNWSKEVIAREKKNIDKMHTLYKDVTKGDRYRLIYVPGIGTSLFLNGQLLGTVQGEDFAKIYYSVWLGDKPIDERLKKGLIGNLK